MIGLDKDRVFNHGHRRGWRLDRRSRRLTDPQERPVALSKSEGKTNSSLLKGRLGGN
jgi:hypothetical protein